MKLRPCLILVLITVCTMLLVSCAEQPEPTPETTTEVGTLVPTDRPHIHSMVEARATDTGPLPTGASPPTLSPWGLLTSLPVEMSAVLSAGSLLNKSINQSSDHRTFIGFGKPKEGTPEVLSPQWEFAVPPGTPALAPITGYVVAIHTLWSDDWTVWLSANGEESRVWEVEHVTDVRVEVGDFVETGQPIATASVFGGREIALVELGLFKGGQPPTHYCPLLYVDEQASPRINDELNKIRKENFDRLNSWGIVIPADDPNGQLCWTDRPVFDSP